MITMMMTQVGVGLSLQPAQDQVLFTLTNAHGGSVPVLLTLEECHTLAHALHREFTEGKKAFDEPVDCERAEQEDWA